MMSTQSAATNATAPGDLFSLDRTSDGILVIHLVGVWKVGSSMVRGREIARRIEDSVRPRRVTFDTRELERWDSSLVSFVRHIVENCAKLSIPIEFDGLPPGLQRLIALAEAVPEATGAEQQEKKLGWLDRVGASTLAAFQATGEILDFLGLAVLALIAFLRGRARYRRVDFLEVLRQCSAGALGIVALISFLSGTIFAFMGAVQLEQFGAAIYVADLVAIGMVREMGAMMTGIIMAGRTGASFAAQIGSMKVTQEMDALSTMGISPAEFLVAPRVIALILMMPLLALYADFFGIMGGAAVGTSMLHLSAVSYLTETINAVKVPSLVGGLVKAAVYGVLVALAGCYQGFTCGSSSSAVGEATTRAVVASIVAIVVACGAFAVVFNVLGI
jgi:phospholipid/cholesterol/gamma-HCH transport system permease protein